MLEDWQRWVGRTDVRRDQVSAIPAAALAATLDRPLAGTELPPLWIWLYLLPLAPTADLGADGHPRRGGFLPPVDLPRRMWAGSRCRFHAPLRIGQAIERRSTIGRIAVKPGPMVFVTVHHAIRAEGRPLMDEDQDIVYLSIPPAFARRPVPPPADPHWRQPVSIDPVLLFRFSALTFNAHRIHYDRRYAEQVEHYPGLVVHGPLQAMLLFEAAAARRPGERPTSFEFRGRQPLFDFDRAALQGRPGEEHDAWDLAMMSEAAGPTMQATIRWGDGHER